MSNETVAAAPEHESQDAYLGWVRSLFGERLDEFTTGFRDHPQAQVLARELPLLLVEAESEQPIDAPRLARFAFINGVSVPDEKEPDVRAIGTDSLTEDEVESMIEAGQLVLPIALLSHGDLRWHIGRPWAVRSPNNVEAMLTVLRNEVQKLNGQPVLEPPRGRLFNQ